MLAAYLPRNNHSSSIQRVSATVVLALCPDGEKWHNLSAEIQEKAVRKQQMLVDLATDKHIRNKLCIYKSVSLADMHLCVGELFGELWNIDNWFSIFFDSMAHLQFPIQPQPNPLLIPMHSLTCPQTSNTTHIWPHSLSHSSLARHAAEAPELALHTLVLEQKQNNHVFTKLCLCNYCSFSPWKAIESMN